VAVGRLEIALPGRGDVPDQVEQVIGLLGDLDVPGALNIYSEDQCIAWGEENGAASRRRSALALYLASHWTAPTVLVGEAPGKDGARWTGVPFTSSRLLTGSGPAEPTATAVHRALADLDCDDKVLLWNVSALFPPGNRNPRKAEIDACAQVLDLICRGRTVFAIGRCAQRATRAPYIRHPSHGGAALFGAGVRIALRSPPGANVRNALDRLSNAG
jgi:uracil-DNA glycosylase